MASDEWDPTAGDSGDDPRFDREFSVAEQLAILSGFSDTPTEFESSGTPFKARDVDFSSHAWMSALGPVQGWLRLPSQLPLADPNEFLRELVIGLGYEDDDGAIEISDGQPRLTDAALDRLRERAERAVDLQEIFVEELESDDGTLATATKRWRDAWEELPEEDEEGYIDEPVSASALTWPITQFVGMAQKGRLELAPSYQRGEVWPTKDAQLLIESILRGIPLPSIIILSPKEQGANRAEVVDGKQRLTAILRFIGQHPKAIEAVKEFDSQHEGKNLKGLFNSDYPKFRRAWKNLRGETLSAAKEAEYYFPFKLRTESKALSGDLESLRGKYYTQIKSHQLRIIDGYEEVGSVFEEQSDYLIPVIRYSRATQLQIHEVFNLYNKQGKHLNAEEIRNAIYHELDLTRAILVAAGDANPDAALTEVAPFLQPAWDDIASIQDTLADYKFGVTRYRRTKVLSWILAMLLFDSSEDGQPRLPSTARHIDTFLRTIQDTPGHTLRDGGVVRDVLVLVAQATEAHAAVDEAWAPRFKDGDKGAKWQELQLVGSLLGVLLGTAVDADGIEDRLAEVASTMREASLSWKRPRKTQTTQQWQYIAKIARGVVDVLGIDAEQASQLLVKRYGSSGIPALWSVKGYADVS